jgi:hypothetical protein
LNELRFNADRLLSAKLERPVEAALDLKYMLLLCSTYGQALHIGNRVALPAQGRPDVRLSQA